MKTILKIESLFFRFLFSTITLLQGKNTNAKNIKSKYKFLTYFRNFQAMIKVFPFLQ